MSEKLTWKHTRVRLGDLKPWERNPRQMTRRQAERLLESWKEFGQVETIAIGPNNEVYNGHQRLSVLKAAYGEDYVVDARQASRALTDAERERLTLLLHAGAVGSWNWDELANWDAEGLIAGGLDEDFVQSLRVDLAALEALFAAEEKEERKTKYSVKMEVPIYEPQTERVELKDLFDRGEYDRLLAEIDAADVPDEFKTFARLAAARFVRFYFDRIADYYAQTSPEEQRILENLAMVIIDVNRAIERGFVDCTDKLLMLIQMEEENGT